MFNNELTRDYNHSDASFEIILMLLGAFLFGFLLCWLIRKFFSKNTKSSESEIINTYIESQNPTKPNNTPPLSQVTSVKKTTNFSYNTPRIDDLTKISGIDSSMQDSLKSQGIRSYIDLRDIDHAKLKDIIGEKTKKSSGLREVETWPHQASLAAKGEWTRLYDYQSFVQRARAASQKNTSSRPKDADDLKKIEGIGPKIEEILNKKGVYTFKQLRKTESDTLKRYIVIEDIRFEKNETESWPHQAGMAEKGQWEELGIYQEFMDYNEVVEDDNLIAANNNDDIDSRLDHDTSNISDNDAMLDLSTIDIESNEDITSINKDYIKLLKDKDNVRKITKDDLQKIEGIGPKIESVLNMNDIHTFKVLHKKDRNTLKNYLENAGPQFKMHEPASWPHQAGMAARGEWNDLRVYQEFMDSGRETPSTSSELKITSPHIKDMSLDDDLRKIEGIGPKIEALLKEAGLDTFEKLKDSNRDAIKAILDSSGPQYRMHEPETWPLQASMAFNGDWEKLKEYQDFLLGGRE